jgi:threonine 3-dehydrogenase
MKAIIKPSKGKGLALTELPLPAIAENEVLVKVLATSICGSDLPIYNWDDPWTCDTIQPGLVPGHEFYGAIEKIGTQVKKIIKTGDIVTAEGHLFCGDCWYCRNGQAHICQNLQLLGFTKNGSYAEYVAVPAVNVIPIPRIPPPLGSIMDPFGNSLHACSKVDLKNADVLIAGCGPIGLMTLILSKRFGAKNVVVIDNSEYRIAMAEKLGASKVFMTVGDVKIGSSIRGFDILFEMSGNEKVVEGCIPLLRPGGTGIFLGLPKSKSSIDFGNDIVAKDISIYGVIGRQIFRTWEQSISLLDSSLTDDPVNLQGIITHEYPLADFEKAFSLMNERLCGKVIMIP